MATQRKKSIADIRAQEKRIFQRFSGGWNSMSERERARATKVTTTARRYVDNINKTKLSQRDLAIVGGGDKVNRRRINRKYARSTYMGLSKG